MKPIQTAKIIAKKKLLIDTENQLAKGDFTNFDFFLNNASTLEALNYALEWASYYGKLPLIKRTIIKGADINYSNCACIQMASGNGHLDAVSYLIELGLLNNLPNPNILIEAIENNHINIVKYLLSDNKIYGYKLFDINTEYDLALRTAIEVKNINMIRLLIEHGANVNALDGSPLISATRTNDITIVEILLQSNTCISQSAIILAIDIAKIYNNMLMVELLEKYII
jgi:ankyrin repeat protein